MIYVFVGEKRFEFLGESEAQAHNAFNGHALLECESDDGWKVLVNPVRVDYIAIKKGRK
jgi:hypothetical protein